MNCFCKNIHINPYISQRLHHVQSRSSLYTEYASCIGPPKHQGPPCSQRVFTFFVWPENSNLFECGALSPSLHKNQSNRVTWMSYSLAKKTKKTSWKRTESWKRWAISSSANRDGVKQTNALHPYFHHVDQQSKFRFRIHCNHSKIDNNISHTCFRSYTSLRGCLPFASQHLKDAIVTQISRRRYLLLNCNINWFNCRGVTIQLYPMNNEAGISIRLDWWTGI